MGNLPHVPSLTEGWGTELLSVKLPSNWSVEWSDACDWNAWQGFESDRAWLIENHFRMPGRVQPVAFCIYGSSSSRVVRVGGLLLELHDESLLRIYPGNTSIVEIMMANNYADSPFGVWHPIDGQLCGMTHVGAFYCNSIYEHNMKQRNRWAEQKARGGCPPENLLLMQSLPREEYSSLWNHFDQEGEIIIFVE